MAKNYGTYGTYRKTDNTGTQEFRYVYNAGGTNLSAGAVVVLAPSATFQLHARADGTNERTFSVDHVYEVECGWTGYYSPNIAGVAIQRIESKTCGWIQTEGYCDSVRLSAGDITATTTFPAGTTVGGGGVAHYGAPRRAGLGRLAANWTVTKGAVSACPVFINTDLKEHWHGAISAGSETATHYLSGTLQMYGNMGLQGNLSAQKLIASQTVSAYNTADLYVNDDSFLTDDTYIGGKLILSSTDTDEGAWLSAGAHVTRGVSTIDALLSENIVVTNNMSATGSISAEGLSANAWVGVNGLFTVDNAGAVVADNVSLVTNLTADSISATGSVSAEGFSANAWIDANGLFTVDNAGAVVADNVGLVTNLTADSISATGSVSAEGFSANSWIDVNSNFGVDSTGATTIVSDLTVDNISATGSISAEGFSANSWLDVGGDTTITGDITVYDISATGSISAEGLSANAWIDLNQSNVTGDGTGWQFSENITANNISATGSISTEGLSTNDWLQVGGDATIVGDLVVDNISATGNLTADTISATSTIYGDAISANELIKVGGTTTSWDIGLDLDSGIVISGSLGLSSEGCIATAAALSVGEDLTVNNISATGSISAEGLSANSWLDVATVVTADVFGLSSAMHLQAEENITTLKLMTADDISATGSISAEGLSANAWVDIGNAATAGALTVTGTGAITGNLTANNISATGSISAEGLSANNWIDASGVIHGQSLEADGDAGVATAGITRITADTKTGVGWAASALYPDVTGDWDINYTTGGPAGSCIWLGVYVGTLKYVVPAFCCSA